MMMDTKPEPVLRFDTIGDLEAHLERSATAPGEMPGLSELDHGLQCAAELAAVSPGDHELQIAGLVHDVCHAAYEIDKHDKLGADAVRGLLGERVAALVGLHVAAKRYLISTDTDYAARLSPVSKHTLELQGGIMTPDEVAAFSASPHAQDAVLLRKADEAAKTPGRVVPGLDHWRPALRQLASQYAR
jgi:hypothetical protein